MSGHRQDIELDDRTLIELIGGIALDLLENNYIEIIPVDIFNKLVAGSKAGYTAVLVF